MIQPYTKLYAQLYDRLFPAGEDEINFYRHFLRPPEHGTHRALECACGTGNILLACLERGVIIDGLDCSSDMLDICAGKAAQHKKQVALHCASMHDFSFAHRYNTIYIPACSFMLLIDRMHAQRALENFYAHLLPGGQLLISLFLPFNETSQSDTVVRIKKDLHDPITDTRTILYESLRYRPFEQLRIGLYRLETHRDGRLHQTELYEFAWRRYGAHEFRLMLKAAGFESITCYGDHALEPAGDHDETIIFKAVK